MISVQVKDFKEWRDYARQLVLQNIVPEEVAWQDAEIAQAGLFNQDAAPLPLSEQSVVFTVPKAFVRLCEKVACHRDASKWALLYQALWRLHQGEKHLLDLYTDPLMHQLRLMYKSVARDAHKMKAFVRFKEYIAAGNTYYLAWYEPDHLVLPLVARFFAQRFAVMNWAILTPNGSLCWDQVQLVHSEQKYQGVELSDSMEDLWKIYYRSIFNPARIKLKAMRREMPVRFWRHLPETKIMQDILDEAPLRVAKMLESKN